MIVDTQVTINGSKAAVWAAISDIANAAAILGGIERIEVVEKPTSGLVGLKWKETRILFGKPATVEKQITEAKENHILVTRAEQDGFVFITSTAIAGDDGEIVLASVHVTMALSFAAKLKSLPRWSSSRA
jgi:carbon monoxide dehydrogenase subunit G